MTATDTPTADHPVVVVGAGLAGHRLAQQLSLLGEREVVLISEEPHPPYNRVLLAEVLAGRYRPELATLAALPAGITHHHSRVVRIDRPHRRVLCDDGAVIGYGSLVLATGSNPVLPPLRGLFEDPSLRLHTHRYRELPSGVFTFRTMADCTELDARLPHAKRAVVVGGGLLGVSAARALAARGVQVLLAHQGEHLMEHHLDHQAAELLKEHLASQQIEVHTECRVRAVLTDAARAVTGVELADGFRLDTELLVLTTGVRPRTGLARAAELSVRQGVVVDDQLRTSDPDVHALGDCAEHDGVVYGLAGPALEQADVLARVLSHRSAAYRGSRLLTRLTLNTPHRPLDLATFGAPEPTGPQDRVVRLADGGRGTYRKVIVRADAHGGDRLVGGVLLGDLDTVGELAHAWQGDEALTTHPLHLLTAHGTPSTSGGTPR